MKYRNLGWTNLRVSCLSLGGNIFGHFCNKKESSTIIHTARDLGINFIDTADVYSEGISERFIGKSIQNHRHNWIIATKAGVRSGESSKRKGHKEHIFRKAEESLRRLGTDYIDVYQMHHFDTETPIEETLGALHSLVEQGKVRYVGVSNYSGRQLKQSLLLANSLDFATFSSIQSHYNLFKRKMENSIFPIAQEMKIGVIIYGTMARGILAGKYQLGQGLPPKSRASTGINIREDLTKTVLNTVANLSAFAESQGQTVGLLAIAWVLRKLEVSTVLIGVRNTSQLYANIGAVNWRLSKSELVNIDNIMGNLEKFQSISLGSYPTSE